MTNQDSTTVEAESTTLSDRLAFAVFILSGFALAFGGGYFLAVFNGGENSDPIINQAAQGIQKAREIRNNLRGEDGDLSWYSNRHAEPLPSASIVKDDAFPGTNLILRIGGELGRPALRAEIRNLENDVIHSWNVGWYNIWSDADHLPEYMVPQDALGTCMIGAVVLEDGRLVFNYEHLGLVCLNKDGSVAWRLPYQTHHSVELDNDGTLLVGGHRVRHTNKTIDPTVPHFRPAYDEYTLLRVSTSGELLEELSVHDLLLKNGLSGLMNLHVEHEKRHVRWDILHLNDVQPFPDSLEPGFFGPGDVLLSFRNVNTVLAFRWAEQKVKFVRTGLTHGQHDPDFVDGDTFSVFDNSAPSVLHDGQLQSRILRISCPEGDADVVYQAGAEESFFTERIGWHQRLPNGNLLLVESQKGRAFEVTADGDIVWQFVNYVSDDVSNLITQVTRLPLGFGGFEAGSGSSGDE